MIGTSAENSQSGGSDPSAVVGWQEYGEQMCYCPCSSPGATRQLDGSVTLPGDQGEVRVESEMPEIDQSKRTPKRNRKMLEEHSQRSY